MAAFRLDQPVRRRKKGFLKLLIILIVTFIVVSVFAIGGAVTWYQQNIASLSSGSSADSVAIVVEEGATVEQIAANLAQSGVIRSERAFQLYSRFNSVGEVKAGTYMFSPSESVATIFERLASGDVTTELVTILPAQRFDQLKQAFIASGYSEQEVSEALVADAYASHLALSGLPAGANLEGYLYPESFIKTDNTPLRVIIEQSLDQMDLALTAERRAAFAARGLSVHEAVILASIIEREVSNPEERRMVAQVFLKRYEIGMMLGSDPTALYGALLAGIEPSVFADTPYNTRIYTGLPPGPINNVSAASLEALANPASTDYLYFVSGDDGITYFSNTLEEHEALTAQHCIELCQSY